MNTLMCFAAATGFFALGAADARAEEFVRLIRAGYFSPECKASAEALAIEPTRDAEALFTAFAHARRRPAGQDTGLGAECADAAVLLVNLFRLNGIEADFAFAIGASGMIERTVVRVPRLKRHFDPAGSAAEQGRLEGAFLAYPARAYLNADRVEQVGSVSGGDGTVVHRGGPPPVPVKTLTIQP